MSKSYRYQVVVLHLELNSRQQFWPPPHSTHTRHSVTGWECVYELPYSYQNAVYFLTH